MGIIDEIVKDLNNIPKKKKNDHKHEYQIMPNEI